MRQPTIPRNEAARLASLHELELLDEHHHHLFEGLAELAAQLFGANTGLISLVDDDRQWFAARHNMDAEETPRSISFCGHAIIGRSVMVVSDARLDSRFRDNPLVTMPENPIRFYAGAPLITPDDLALGTLCVLDSTPKYPSERQIQALEQLAKLAVDQMELRRHMLRREQQSRAAYQQHRARAQQLQDLGQDLRTALEGVLAMTRRVEDKASEMGLEHSISALKHSAMSLFHVTDMLTLEGTEKLEHGGLRVSRVDPMSVAATVIAIYSAESERRGIVIQLHGHEHAVGDIETEQELLRLALFHALGFALRHTSEGDINVTIRARQPERKLHIDLCYPSNTVESPSIDTAELNAVLQGHINDSDCRADHLFSLHRLLVRLKGVGAVRRDNEQHITISVQLPMSLTANITEASSSTTDLRLA